MNTVHAHMVSKLKSRGKGLIIKEHLVTHTYLNFGLNTSAH